MASRRILVADDNHDAADSLAALLRTLGHRAEVAYDGLQAFEILRDHPFDAAVLDIGMPELNGYDLARSLRSEEWGRKLRLIALTGWGQPEDRERAVECGFNAHLTKPVLPERLLAAVAGDGVAETESESGERKRVGSPQA